MTHLDAAVRALRPARRIMVFTGAGISTESGIPDFRGPDGLWNRVDPDLFTITRYLKDPEVRRQSWRMHLDGGLRAITGASPNPAHRAVVDLWRAGRWAGCVTQNIDGLHQAAGLPARQVAELHGNLRRVGCAGCGASWPTAEVLERVRGGEQDPPCPDCGGILKTSTVMFGELLPADQLELAASMSEEAEAVLA
ncbi:MAG: SIR2 family NAD-dependent protein deacylase, partial [Acidimicrobiia bacterium]